MEKDQKQQLPIISVSGSKIVSKPVNIKTEFKSDKKLKNKKIKLLFIPNSKKIPVIEFSIENTEQNKQLIGTWRKLGSKNILTLNNDKLTLLNIKGRIRTFLKKYKLTEQNYD